MPDIQRSKSELLTSLFQDGQLGGISAQDMRDLIISLMPPTKNITTTAYTALLTDTVLLVDDDTAGAAVTVTLPVAATAESGFFLVIFKKGTTGNVVIDGAGAETINGAATQSLVAQYESIKIVTDGNSWFVIEA